MEKLIKEILKSSKKEFTFKKESFINYNSDFLLSDGPDTFTKYNWTLDKNGNITPYSMYSFSMPEESLMGVDPLNPDHDKFRTALDKIKKFFDL